MNFKDGKYVRTVIWCEGPLLSVMEHGDKVYMVKWADATDDGHDVWLIFEVASEILGLYFAKAFTMREVEERSPAVFIGDGDLSEAAWTDYENVPEDWKARVYSYYDPDLEYNYK